VPVHQGQLLDLVPAQQPQRRLRGDAHLRRDERRLGHHLRDAAPVVDFEAHVPVGDDADEHTLAVGHRNPGDAVAGAQRVDVREGVLRRARHRVGNHPCLGALDHLHLRGLLLGCQVAVQHSHPALAGHRDGHPRLGDRVHGRGDQRHPQRDVARQPGRGVDLAGDDVGLRGQQQHVIEGQSE